MYVKSVKDEAIVVLLCVCLVWSVYKIQKKQNRKILWTVGEVREAYIKAKRRKKVFLFFDGDGDKSNRENG